MQNVAKGGKAFYGEAIGMLMMDARVPRIPGDIWNATTFDFPVRYKVVKGVTAANIIEDVDPNCLKLFIEAGKELEACFIKLKWYKITSLSQEIPGMENPSGHAHLSQYPDPVWLGD